MSDVDMEYIRSIRMQFGQELFLVIHLMRRHREKDVKLKKNPLASLNFASILSLLIYYPDMHLK